MATPADSLRIALSMERRGHALYTRARAFTHDEALRACFARLAAEEAEHYAHFQSMLAARGAAGHGEPPGTEPQVLADSLAAEVFYPGGLMQLEAQGALADKKALLTQALQSEAEAIALYTSLLPLASPDEAETLRHIIAQERTHDAQLQAALAQAGAADA